MTNKINIPRSAWLLLLLCAVVLLPFLGLAEFHTKGEPREAVVAYSILDSGNWILPTNNGGEIPYKPPFFHWCIAALSLLNGGVVNEFTSRMPSAIALIAMTVATFTFFARRKNPIVAMATALIAFTTFELHRAGANCRVDMVLTALTVGAIYLLCKWYEKGMHAVPWWAILLMSLATLTKGPVGVIIPCLVTGVFLLLRHVSFFKAFGLLFAWGCMSLVLPLAWYVAAYAQGGEEFLALVLEENFGRMTGTMSYESCVNPWPYNILTLIAGFVPWTLAVLMALFALPWRSMGARLKASRFSVLLKKFEEIPSVNLLAGVAAVVVFVFYCIPQSKRSVYLMPMYPFTAFFVAELLMYVSRRHLNIIRAFGDIMASIAVLLPVCMMAIKAGFVPDSIFGHGRHAAENIAMMKALASADTLMDYLCMAVSPLVAALWWCRWRRRAGWNHVVQYASFVIMGIYVSLAGVYQPAVLNVKSVKDIAAEIDAVAPAEQGDMYEFIERSEFADGDPIHFFEIDFYLGDRMASFYKRRPDSGFLLVSDADAVKFFPQFEAEGYSFTPCYIVPRPLIGQATTLYSFSR